MLVSQSELLDVLRLRFGLEQFRPKQAEVIEHVMSGRHTFALLPTGYGKSLCYQVPSQVLPGVTLVVSPLIALMQDQVNGLLRRGITNATMLNSTVSLDEQEFRIAGIKSGAFKLVYVAPERFESQRFRNLLNNVRISLLVIDEAHCISQWGHDFRPQYRNLSSHLSHLDGATVLALTATATQQVQKDIIQSLALPEVSVVVGSVDRPNLRFEVIPCRNNHAKDSQIFDVLHGNDEPAIVYTSSRKEAEALSQRLRVNRIQAACYHAGMHADDRQRTQKNFQSEKTKVIVSTVAFGMGVDKANIRRVIHYNLPGSLENYYQEAGRAGRDGQPATCTLLYQAKDIYTQRWLMDRNYPNYKQVGAVLATIVSSGLKPMRAQEILSRVEISDTALNSALDLLKSLQLIDNTPDGGFLDRTSEADPAINMTSLNMRKQRDSTRLERMIRYAQVDTCRRKEVMDYFGQTLDNECTGCDVCAPLAGKSQAFEHEDGTISGGAVEYDSRFAVSTMPARSAPKRTVSNASLEEDIIALVRELRGRVGRTSVAQILVGSKSKKLKEKGLNALALFGKYASMSQDSALEHIDQLIERQDLKVLPGLYPKLVVASKHSKL